MPWRQEKTESGTDLVYDGVEMGIGPSPTKGTANIQNANISTESGQVMASFARTSQTPSSITGGTLTPSGSTDFTGPSSLSAGQWIKVTASTVSSITAATNPTTVSVDYLVVGGGGAGGSNTAGGSGGGGAGRYVSSSGSFSAQSYAVTVGYGGEPTALSNGGFGGPSAIAGVATAQGGAGGGTNGSAGSAAVTGGSGGGGGGGATNAGGAGATGGNSGGNGNGTTINSGGGGGGSGSVGAAANSTSGGNGGTGTSNSITGTATFYAAGGGGGVDSGIIGIGGSSIGGNGGNASVALAPSNGIANTGSGGGGAAGGDPATVGGYGGTGIVVLRYLTGTAVATGGTMVQMGAYTIHIFTSSGIFTIMEINPGGWYYVSYKNGTTYRLSSRFDPTGANVLTHGTTGSITFSTVAVPSRGIAKATEKYTNATSAQYRYYILDSSGHVWLFDTYINSTYGTNWMLSDPFNYSSLSLSGMAVLNGMLLTVGIALIYGKPTTNLGNSLLSLTGANLNEPFPTHTNFAYVGSQGKMYYCDGNYIGEVFPTTSLVTSVANVQSVSKYTSSTITGTITEIVTGSLPYEPTGTRIPAVFYTDVYGTQPTNLTMNKVYFIQYNPGSHTFETYSALTGGAPINVATGAVGNQYFSTFWPIGNDAGTAGTNPLVQISTQRVNLPAFETAQCMVEIGNTVMIGTLTNALYSWDQVAATPDEPIPLPEANVRSMINVNNVAYVLAGNKGNIYVTNGSVSSLALKVPDYCAGVPGSQATYVEPMFTWGDSDYIRGRVYFSILDQTSTKAGNCGGVWSFVPIQNVDPSQDIGMALRLENRNSYGDYDGMATLIIPALVQDQKSPQYWTSWQDSYSTGTSSFGIDASGSVPVTSYVVETDLAPTGTFLGKTTFAQIEYKLATPLLSTDAVQVYYRLNTTDAWLSCGTLIEETASRISGLYQINFDKTQWTQLRAEITTPGTADSSFVRLTEIRIR